MELHLKKPNRKTAVLIGLGAIGVLLILVSFLPKTEEKVAETTMTYYTEALETRIAELVNAVDGVSGARVLLTLDSGSEFVYAQKSEPYGSGVASDYLIVQTGEGESGILIQEIYPRIRGLAVVCNGGDNPVIQKTLTELLAAALGISSGKIRVAGR